MIEFTMGGTWFRWSLLDRTSKRLAAGSLIASVVAVAPATLSLSSHAYDVGYRLGSGSAAVPEAAVGFPPWSPLEACWLIGFGIVSALLWWRFSLRQDELFNRVQNWALGMAGAWSATLLTIWAMLALGNLAPPVSPMGIIATFYVSTCAFWFAAVRRWV